MEGKNVINTGVVIGATGAGIIASLVFGWTVDTLVQLVMAGTIFWLVKERGK